MIGQGCDANKKHCLGKKIAEEFKKRALSFLQKMMKEVILKLVSTQLMR